MELVEVTDEKTGKKRVKKMADKTTRLEAMKIVNTMVASMQPKGAAVEVNVSQTNQTANLGSAETMEERLARLRKKAAEHNLLPPAVVGVPEVIDAGGSILDGEEGDYVDDDDEEDE